MTEYEDVARQKLSIAVDNTQHRQLPFPAPWYERWFYLAALVVATLCAAFVYAAWVGIE